MTTISNSTVSDYPLDIELKGSQFVIREMKAGDGEALLKYAQGLPAHDRLYMRRDITKQEGVDQWLAELDTGRIYSFLAFSGDEVVGYATINLTNLDWTRHVADLRVSVAGNVRNSGLGRILVREGFKFAVTLGIEIVTARMTPDQKGARALFEELGFRNEAVMKDYIKDRNGEYHDLLIMAVNVEAFLAQRQAYGIQ